MFLVGERSIKSLPGKNPGRSKPSSFQPWAAKLAPFNRSRSAARASPGSLRVYPGWGGRLVRFAVRRASSRDPPALLLLLLLLLRHAAAVPGGCGRAYISHRPSRPRPPGECRRRGACREL